MQTQTTTFYTVEKDGKLLVKTRRGKLSFETLNKYKALSAYCCDIDTHNPSKGYFNKRDICLGKTHA